MTRLHGKVLLVLIISILLSGTGIAKTLTLDDCIELALKYNEDVIRARNQVKVADGNVWNAFGNFLPSLNVSLNGTETHTERTDFFLVPFVDEDASGIIKSYSLGGRASWTLFNGGRNIFNYFGAKEDKKRFKYIAESSELELIYQVKLQYFAYLNAIDQKDIAEKAVKRGEEQFKLANSKYEVGSASKSEVLKAQVQYGNDKLGLIATDNTVRVEEANLKFLIGVAVNSDDVFSEEYTPSEYSGTEEEALKFGLAHYPGLLASEHNMVAAKYDVRSTFGRYLPTLSLDLSKSWAAGSWGTLTDFNSENAQLIISTTLSLPIFQGFDRKRDMTRAKVTLNNANAELYYSRNNVALEIKESYLEIERTIEALKVANENVLAADEDMSLTQEKYNLGAATILELLDAQVSLITAQISQASAEFGYNLAVAKLEKAMGIR